MSNVYCDVTSKDADGIGELQCTFHPYFTNISLYYIILLIKVHTMMKMCTRSILGITDKRISSSVQLFQTSGLMPVDVQIYYFTGIQMFNIIHGNAPSYLK